MGGSDESSNLVEVSVVQHAMWHFANWQLWGNIEDKVAWKALSGCFGKEEIIDQLLAIARSKIDYSKVGETLRNKFNDNPELRAIRSKQILEAFEELDVNDPDWRIRLSEKIRSSGGPQRSVQMRRQNNIGMFNNEWQKEMAGRAGASNAKNKTGFCRPDVAKCPIRKARGGRASCLNRQGVKINRVKHFPECFEYRTCLSSDFINYYVHFGMG
jgi:hypothetical protein